jgi:putative aminopeptidase FrvX
VKLLQDLIKVPAPSGDEFKMKEFLLEYIQQNQHQWQVKPQIHAGEDLMDGIILVFGKPRTAIFAHMDSTGFTARYENQLVPIGGPEAESGYQLVGQDAQGEIECELMVDEGGRLFHDFSRPIIPGTSLTFKPTFKIEDHCIIAPYLDNRMGIYNALKVAPHLENGMIVFTTYEEHGGGNIPLLLDYIHKHFPIRQALISDITWVTDGVKPDHGVVISLRDRSIPRRSYVNRILSIAQESGIPFQLEVEGAGSSDGREIHHAPYPIDWCFIGAPEQHVHSPFERVHVHDLDAMIHLYQYLMARL